MNFEGHVASHRFVCLKKNVNTLNIVRRFLITEEAFKHVLEPVPSRKFNARNSSPRLPRTRRERFSFAFAALFLD